MDKTKLEEAAIELAKCGMSGAAPLAGVLAMHQHAFDQKYGPTSLQTAAMERVGEVAPLTVGSITISQAAPFVTGLAAPGTMHWLTRAARSFDEIEAALRNDPDVDKIGFSAAEMRMVMIAWKAEAELGQKFREMVYTNCAVPAATDQIALDAAGEIMKVVSSQYPPGGPTQVKAAVQTVVAAALARASASTPPKAAAPGQRKWTLLLTGADKGLVGEFGKRWPGEESYDHVDVQEAPPAAGAEEFGAIGKPDTTERYEAIAQAYGVSPEVVDLIVKAAGGAAPPAPPPALSPTLEFAATRMVHTPNGPTPCCDKHAAQLSGLFGFLGCGTVHTLPGPMDQCANCLNEAGMQERKE